MARRWAVVAVGLVGCSAFKSVPPVDVNAPRPPAVAVDQEPPQPAVGREDPKPVAVPPPSPEPPPDTPPPTDSLALAADALSRGDRLGAATHFEAHVREHPEQLMFRAQLAELLVRLGRDDAAKVHFERFAADARTATGAAKDHLVHAHTRLMEIAQRDDDRFGEAFHRGVGLLLLVREQDGDPRRDDLFCEEMLCKALKSLREARELKPHAAEVGPWLADAYDRTGNRRAADAERAAAGTPALSPLR